MTAVEWFALQLGITSGTMIEQAKEIYKQQMQDFGARCCLMTKQKNEWTLEKLYNDLYGNKGSDDHVPDVKKMVEKPINLTSSQTEISTLIIYNDIENPIQFLVVEGDYSRFNGVMVNAVKGTGFENEFCDWMFDKTGERNHLGKWSDDKNILENKNWNKVAICTWLP